MNVLSSDFEAYVKDAAALMSAKVEKTRKLILPKLLVAESNIQQAEQLGAQVTRRTVSTKPIFGGFLGGAVARVVPAAETTEYTKALLLPMQDNEMCVMYGRVKYDQKNEVTELGGYVARYDGWIHLEDMYWDDIEGFAVPDLVCGGADSEFDAIVAQQLNRVQV